jgi:hypothetical protein
MINKILKSLQEYIMSIINMCKGLPIVIAILVVIAIIVIPDPVVILGTIVLKKFKVIV